MVSLNGMSRPSNSAAWRSELDPRVAEEAEEQVALRSDSVASLSSGDGHHLHVALAPVGELLTLEVRPQPLDGVQLGCVRGQPPHLQAEGDAGLASGFLGRNPARGVAR